MNLPSIIILMVLGLILIGVIIYLISNKKKGKGGCSCCSSYDHCPYKNKENCEK